MVVQYYTGSYPWWDDSSLSKPSKTLFTNTFENQTSSWTTVNNPVVLSLTYNSAVIQFNGNQYPANNNTYYRISLVGNSNYYYFFTDTIEFDNLTSTPTVTVTLRLDKWGTCVSNLTNDFDSWTTQVLATNIEVNLYQFWTSIYSNLSSYTFMKKIFPEHQNIQLIKYSNNQFPYVEQTQNENNEGINMNGNYYYFYKITYLVSAFNATPNATTTTELHGNYKDYYTTQQTVTNTNLEITTKLPESLFLNPLPYIAWCPIVSYEESQFINTDYNPAYTLIKWTLNTLLSFSTDKDIGLIQLPFCLSNKNLISTYEGYITDNYWLTTGTANYEFWSGGYWQLLHPDTYTNAGMPNPSNLNVNDIFPAYFINANGVVLSQDFGGMSMSQNDATNIDANIFSLLLKDGWNSFISTEPWSFSGGLYQLSPFLIMYPYLWNFYSFNWAYMGQEVSFSIKYVNNIFNLWPIINVNGISNPDNFYCVFSANYPNLTLNYYSEDNVIGNNKTPIGQINLSTALLPNTTNPEATFETNERKIINNAATLKNLDLATASLSYLGGLGLNSLLNPLSLFTNAASLGLDMDKINLNYSNSFGSAKQYELSHSNTLQTAGDNLGNPDNVLTWYQLVPALNDIQTLIGHIDKYGYPYNQWTRFKNLFANYYHNYVKLSQNADLLIYQNAPLLLKDWQSYLINQLISGVVIWNNLMPDGSISFVDSWQLYNDCINNKENFWNMSNWDTNYHANFKLNHNVSNLTVIENIPTKPKNENIVNMTSIVEPVKPKVEFKNKAWQKL